MWCTLSILLAFPQWWTLRIRALRLRLGSVTAAKPHSCGALVSCFILCEMLISGAVAKRDRSTSIDRTTAIYTDEVTRVHCDAPGLRTGRLGVRLDTFRSKNG